MPVAYEFPHDLCGGNIPLFAGFLSPSQGQPRRLLAIGAHESGSARWLIDNMADHPLSRLEAIDGSESEKLGPGIAAAGRPTASMK